MQEADLYALLGVSRTASADEVKKAYRKLARKHHPDVNPGNREAEERFKAISQAHEILTDPAKRRLYDEFGLAGVQAGFDAERAREYQHRSHAWEQRRRPGTPFAGEHGQGGYTSFEDIFGDVFGEGVPRGGPQRGADVEYELEIDLLDAVRGLATTVTLQRPEGCSACGGKGIDAGSGVTCRECGGEGRMRMGRGPVAFTRTCARCAGTGRTDVRPCSTCGGAGQRVKSERLTVRIPPGVDTGSRVRIAEKGGAGMAGGGPGDAFIRVRVRPHPVLERKGDDLYMDVPVTVREAIWGESITVPAPDRVVRVRVPPGSQTGRQLRVKGHGVPRLKGRGRGDLYLRLVVQIPDQQPEAVREASRALDAGYSRNPRENLRL